MGYPMGMYTGPPARIGPRPASKRRGFVAQRAGGAVERSSVKDPVMLEKPYGFNSIIWPDNRPYGPYIVYIILIKKHHSLIILS